MLEKLIQSETPPSFDGKAYVMGLLRQEFSDNHLHIGREFFPSSLTSPEKRESELHVHGYNSIKGNSEYLEAAADSGIVLVTMDAGKGLSVNRDQYLEEMSELLYDRGFLDGQKGAKSMDLYLFWQSVLEKSEGLFRSVADVKIQRAIHQSSRYKNTEIEVLVNDESLGPMQGLYERHRAALDALGISVSFRVEKPLPYINKETSELHPTLTFPGGHGYAGRLILDSIRENRQQKQGSVHAIYNGDGVNNGVSPEMVGFLKKSKAAFVMLTTTRTPADVKGGILGLKSTSTLENGPVRVPAILEQAQAKEPEQKELHAKVGISNDSEIGGCQHYQGEQYFNTNTVLMNDDLLHGFLNRIYKEMGPDEYNRIVSPEFMRKTTKIGDEEYFLPEGALGSLVLRLNEEVHTNKRLKEMWTEISGDSEFLQIVNLEPENRDEFFTPVKHSVDFLLQEYSDRYYLETDPASDRYATIVNMSSTPPPQMDGDLIEKNSYYGKVWNLVHSFGFARMRELESLDIRGAVVCPNAIWKGNVRILSYWDKSECYIIDQYYLKKLLDQTGRDQLTLENIEILIDSMGNMFVRQLDAVKTN